MDWQKILLTVAVFVCAGSHGSADERTRNEVIRSIIASWKERHSQVQTLMCSGKVTSFFPKGYVSDEQPPHHLRQGEKKTCPEKDSRFVEEPISWAIDFENQRVRLEKNLTGPHYYHDGSYKLIPHHELYLVADGKSRLFRPKDDPSKKNGESGVLSPDATLYESAAHPFILSLTDLPLLWIAGGVSGQYPFPTQMKHLDDVARFSYRGEAQWKGHDCVVITVPEQKSPTAVREFWVGAEKPHLIYLCQARDGEKVYWQIAAEYSYDQGQPTIPRAWVYTQYGSINPKMFHTREVRIEQARVNATLPPDLFEKPLKPGMLVFDVAKNTPLEVGEDGSLGPLGHYQEKGRRIWIWLVAGTLVLLTIIVVAWRHFRAPSRGKAL